MGRPGNAEDSVHPLVNFNIGSFGALFRKLCSSAAFVPLSRFTEDCAVTQSFFLSFLLNILGSTSVLISRELSFLLDTRGGGLQNESAGDT